jgi:hypothetical protein
MFKLLARVGEAIRSMFLLVFPMSAGAAGAAAEAANPAARWVVRSVLVSLILGLLWWINSLIHLEGWVPYGVLGQLWLPLFALGLYAMLWLGWWLYLVLKIGIEPLSSEFPDIDAAWEQATRALGKAEISVDSTPLFLVLGWTAGTEENLYQAVNLKLKLKRAPEESDAPLHVSANRDGVWVTCPGASVLGQYRSDPGGPALESTLSGLASDSGPDSNRTFGAGGGGGATVGIEEILSSDSYKKILAKGGTRTTSTFDPRLARARLRHLCRLIIRDRKGYCPVNGLLVVVPFSATENERDVTEIARACNEDLAEIHATFRARFPIFFLIGGLDEAEGFANLVECTPASQVNNRRGQRFPFVPEIPADKIPERVRSSVEWIAETYLPAMVNTSFQVEAAGGADLDDVLKANSRIFQFLSTMLSRKQKLAELVTDSLPHLEGEPLFFGGCYVAGTGGAPGQKAFAAGVVERMLKEVDAVAWSSEYLDQDAAYQRTAGYLKGVLNVTIAAAVVGIVALIGLIATGSGGETGAS